MLIYSRTPQLNDALLISLAQAKANLVIEHDLDDALISSIIQAAYQSVETHLNRLLLNQAIIYQVITTSNSFSIEMAEPQTYKSVGDLVPIYTDGTIGSATSKTIKLNGNCIEFSEIVTEAAKDVFAYRATINYEPKLLSEAINQAVYLTITHMNENRNGVVIGVSAKELPLGVKHLLAPHKFYAV